MTETHFILLLVEDDPGDAQLIQAELKLAVRSSFHVTCVDTLEKAVSHLSSRTVDIVLLDLRLPDSVGLETLDRLRAVSGRVPILVLTGLEDEELGVQALRRGAQDYLVKGWAMSGHAGEWRSAMRAGTPDFLVRGQLESSSLSRFLRFAIERSGQTPVIGPLVPLAGPAPAASSVAGVLRRKALEKDLARSDAEPRGAPARCIGLLGAKGGAGTSTIAINLAAAFHRLGRAPALVELRANEGSVATSLHQRPVRTLADLLKLPVEQLTGKVLGQHLTRTAGGWRVLYSPTVGQVLPGISQLQFEALFAALKELPGPVVLDFPFRGASGLRRPIQECDTICVITEALPTAMATARAAVEALASWGIPRGAVAVIALRRYSMTTNMTAEELGAQLGRELLGVIPPAGEECVRADERGTSIVELEPDCIASLTFLQIASRLVEPAGRPAK